MKVGKVPENVLKRSVFKQIHTMRPEVVLGAGVGEDCAAVQLAEDETLVMSTDPITGTAKDIGTLAIQITVNDLASAGAEPVGVLLTVLLPTSVCEQDLCLMMKQVEEACAKATNSSDIQLMARAINGEARGEPYEGQVAVGAVILNRVKSSQFPNSISGVIYQAGAFTAVSDGQINSPISENSTVYKAARDAINGWDPTGGCIYYFNPDTATNKWIWSRPLVKVIGKHRFCK